ncbi:MULTISPECIES: DUF2789 family protein [Acinetobacter]|uniref:DUF2789 domain-containing protein n=3 Tax=Acinetobacter haemolyticus TaxID=29430 RepID=A0A1L6KQK5_ACIHA|nr:MULTISPECIES: DUF2789 family protein [Acinetobacter]APR71363.1 hypothetical protein AHTJS_14065 [Acinetobacter haemolyticus]ATZ68198.1 hypothetical protein BSR56_13135 [Acinetobacter haemolyticus]AZN67358.1 DUF2789 domain-containing protein [Acinetobacter haemolyticus]EEH69697.1 hypothetical protein HMPREF0023_0806 [Acinetobacter sp. ATCC 27244]EFF83633.1 hypothetical protein HMP0015_0888 [Acinetobacter haemolyticus ATCC 19194]
MFEQQPTLELLFEQLGLEADEAAMELFIQTHQLRAEEKLHEADFWSAGQRDFLKSHWEKDDEWAIVIDELNQQLHVDSTE